jgi:hypothetical protein
LRAGLWRRVGSSTSLHAVPDVARAAGGLTASWLPLRALVSASWPPAALGRADVGGVVPVKPVRKTAGEVLGGPIRKTAAAVLEAFSQKDAHEVLEAAKLDAPQLTLLFR